MVGASSSRPPASILISRMRTLRLPGAASQAHSPGADSEKAGFKPRTGTVQGRPCPLCSLRCKAGTWHVTAEWHTPRARMAGGLHRALGRRGPKKLRGEARDCPGRVITRGHHKGLRLLLRLLCAFKRRSTLSGLLRRSRVKPGTTVSSWGVEPWETLWGRWRPR